MIKRTIFRIICGSIFSFYSAMIVDKLITEDLVWLLATSFFTGSISVLVLQFIMER